MKFNKDTKEFIQFISSLFVLITGIVMIFISLFMDPVGQIHPSVIGTFGMFLGFVGAVWNIDIKYTYKVKELENELRKNANGGEE